MAVKIPQMKKRKLSALSSVSMASAERSTQDMITELENKQNRTPMEDMQLSTGHGLMANFSATKDYKAVDNFFSDLASNMRMTEGEDVPQKLAELEQDRNDVLKAYNDSMLADGGKDTSGNPQWDENFDIYQTPLSVKLRELDAKYHFNRRPTGNAADAADNGGQQPPADSTGADGQTPKGVPAEQPDVVNIPQKEPGSSGEQTDGQQPKVNPGDGSGNKGEAGTGGSDGTPGSDLHSDTMDPGKDNPAEVPEVQGMNGSESPNPEPWSPKKNYNIDQFTDDEAHQDRMKPERKIQTLDTIENLLKDNDSINNWLNDENGLANITDDDKEDMRNQLELMSDLISKAESFKNIGKVPTDANLAKWEHVKQNISRARDMVDAMYAKLGDKNSDGASRKKIPGYVESIRADRKMNVNDPDIGRYISQAILNLDNRAGQFKPSSDALSAISNAPNTELPPYEKDFLQKLYSSGLGSDALNNALSGVTARSDVGNTLHEIYANYQRELGLSNSANPQIDFNKAERQIKTRFIREEANRLIHEHNDSLTSPEQSEKGDETAAETPEGEASETPGAAEVPVKPKRLSEKQTNNRAGTRNINDFDKTVNKINGSTDLPKEFLDKLRSDYMDDSNDMDRDVSKKVLMNRLGKKIRDAIAAQNSEWSTTIQKIKQRNGIGVSRGFEDQDLRPEDEYNIKAKYFGLGDVKQDKAGAIADLEGIAQKMVSGGYQYKATDQRNPNESGEESEAVIRNRTASEVDWTKASQDKNVQDRLKRMYISGKVPDAMKETVDKFIQASKLPGRDTPGTRNSETYQAAIQAMAAAAGKLTTNSSNDEADDKQDDAGVGTDKNKNGAGKSKGKGKKKVESNGDDSAYNERFDKLPPEDQDVITKWAESDSKAAEAVNQFKDMVRKGGITSDDIDFTLLRFINAAQQSVRKSASFRDMLSARTYRNRH
jgi:ribosomal protein L20A (L18A)